MPMIDHTNVRNRRTIPIVSPNDGSYPNSLSANEYEPSLVPKFAGIKNITDVKKRPKTYRNSACEIVKSILRKYTIRYISKVQDIVTAK